MKMKKNRFMYAIFVAALLLVFAEDSLRAAQEAVQAFCTGFLPSMLPFFLLGPYLAGKDAQRAFERMFGGVLRRMFRVSGRAAGAIAVGLAAGSPAGAIACAGMRDEMTAGEYGRACVLSCGLSPAFLITTVGGGYMGDPQAGAMLLLCHVLATLLSGLVLRKMDLPDIAPPKRAAEGVDGDIFLQALSNLWRVLCWMTVFSIGLALAGKAAGEKTPLWLATPLCEAAGGMRLLAQAPVGREVKMVLLAFAAGFGGLCVACQCSAATGMKMGVLLPVKALQGALCAAMMALMLRTDFAPAFAATPDIFGGSVLLGVGLVALVAIFSAAMGKRCVDGSARGLYTK